MSSRHPKPNLQAMLVCDHIIQEINGKYSLIGIFSEVRCLKFPARHSRLALYMRLTNAEGSYQFKIQLLSPSMDIVTELGANLTAKSRLTPSEISIVLEDVVFVSSGVHEFRFLVDGSFIGSAKLNVDMFQECQA